ERSRRTQGGRAVRVRRQAREARVSAVRRRARALTARSGGGAGRALWPSARRGTARPEVRGWAAAASSAPAPPALGPRRFRVDALRSGQVVDGPVAAAVARRAR